MGHQTLNIYLVDDLVTKLLNISVANFRYPRDYGTGVNILASEIHLLETIYDHSTYNVSELAGYLGVTKSMISQTTKSLEKKGFLRRAKYRNNKEVRFELTDLGLAANQAHSDFHKKWCHVNWTKFDRYTEAEQQLIIDFLIAYTQYMQEMGDFLKAHTASMCGQK